MKTKQNTQKTNPVMKKAVLDLDGAHCASCAYTIEHLGRKVEGVEDIRVVTDKGEIHVQFDGNPASLEKIVEIVKLIGYKASIRWDSLN